MSGPREWDTVRSDCGRARLTYRTDWDASQPWASYVNGTAGRHYPTARAGVEALRGRGFRFTRATMPDPASDVAPARSLGADLDATLRELRRP